MLQVGEILHLVDAVLAFDAGRALGGEIGRRNRFFRGGRRSIRAGSRGVGIGRAELSGLVESSGLSESSGLAGMSAPVRSESGSYVFVCRPVVEKPDRRRAIGHGVVQTRRLLGASPVFQPAISRLISRQRPHEIGPMRNRKVANSLIGQQCLQSFQQRRLLKGDFLQQGGVGHDHFQRPAANISRRVNGANAGPAASRHAVPKSAAAVCCAYPRRASNWASTSPIGCGRPWGIFNPLRQDIPSWQRRRSKLLSSNRLLTS